ncbi:Flocculation suppression protein [Tieghemiomyces parasiticus]|uniref:Flocculation suppression protein n=1 Tax=Tieghemiomyces parasiticus TaxID=78921 RepID=A0A9W8DYU4_9FUNG|nr:Flocculation suppression protein [Tieghemiomyces parasiticus]
MNLSIIESPQNQRLIRWSRCGSKFAVTNHNELARKILPQYFKHGNWQSFVRQLNMYGFHKVNDVFHGGASTGESTQLWEFRHPAFLRGRPDLLNDIKRRTPKSGQACTHPHHSPSLDSPWSKPSRTIAPEPLLIKSASSLSPPAQPAIESSAGPTPVETITTTTIANTPVSEDPLQGIMTRLDRLERTNYELRTINAHLSTENAALTAAQRHYQRSISKLANFLTTVFSEEESCDPHFQAQARKKRKLESLALNSEITQILSTCERAPPRMTPAIPSFPSLPTTVTPAMSNSYHGRPKGNLTPAAHTASFSPQLPPLNALHHQSSSSTTPAAPCSHLHLPRIAVHNQPSSAYPHHHATNIATMTAAIPSPVSIGSPRVSSSPGHSPENLPSFKFILSTDRRFPNLP